jgi:signal transduction histidine kinase
VKYPKQVQHTARASLQLLYEVGREFAAAQDLRTVLHRVLFLSMKYVGAVSGSIIVLDDQGKPMESAFLIHGKPKDQTTLQLRVTYERGMAGWVARNRQAVLIPDTSQDERWLRLPDDEEGRTGPKSAVSVPILARDGLVGVITLVHPTPGFFTQEHFELVKAIADQAGIYILNARLYAESQRLREELTAMVYHDLRSPLTNIISSLEVINTIASTLDNKEIKSMLGIAFRSTDRIQRLTNTLLDINRLEAGQEIGDRYPASPRKLVDESVETALPIIQARELELSIDVPPDLPNVYVDADMIRRVLINLIENAIKYSPPKGKIVVGAKEDGEFTRMWVSDLGPGISSIDRERIFDKFTRITSSEGSKGFGLGLAYCRLAVVGHGGQIWVESGGKTGSSFYFTLPIKKKIE